jgi:hypothetical protein
MRSERGIEDLGAKKKSPRPFDLGDFLFTAGGDLLSRWRSIIGPAGLTAVFGMGTGVAPRVWPPTKARHPLVEEGGLQINEERGSRKRRSAFVWSNTDFGELLDPLFARPRSSALSHGRRPVKVAKLSTVSTGCLRSFLTVQLRPINRVVYPGSLGGRAPTEPSSWRRLHA